MALKRPWFVVKRYGYGLAPSGWGWPFTFVYVALLACAAIYAARFGRAAAVIVVALLLAGFFLVMALTSDGKPWRWRNGDDAP